MKKCLQTFFVAVLFFFLCADGLLAQPTAGFTIVYAMPSCVPATFSFTNSSSGIAPLTFTWQFIDAQHTDTATNPVFTFDTCGNFSVILTVTDSNGLTDADTQHVLIFCPPQVQFTFIQSISCDTSFVSFYDGTIGTPQIRLWNFGDPSSGADDSSVLKSPTHHYSAPGEYVITLEITSAAGCVAVKSDSLIVHGSPAANFNIADTSICFGDSAFFIDGSTSGDSIVHWLYNFGDTVSGAANLDSSQNAAHVFSAAGEFVVALTVKTEFGCENTITHSIKVNPLPAVTITNDITKVCKNGNPIVLLGSPSGGIFSGSGVSDSTFNPSLADTAGSYQIIYTFTDSLGCANSASTIMQVLPLPQITVTSDTMICQNDSLQLNANGGNHFLWNPSEGLSNDTIANPIAFPQSTTKYFVTVTDSNVCSSTDSVLISIFSLSSIDAGNDTSLCVGGNIMLQASGGNQYSWTPSTGLSDSTIATPIASPLVNTTYTVTVTSGNCAGKDSVKVIVNPLPIVQASNDTFVCKGSSIQLNAEGALNYSWQPASSLNDSLIQNPIAAPESSTKYFVTGTDVHGCKGTDSVFVEVKNLPNVQANNDTAICLGDTLQLHATGANIYLWSPIVSLSNPIISNPLAFPTTTTQYVVTGTNLFGCTNTDTVLVSVHFSGNFISANDTSTCFGNPITLSATGAESYSWSPGNVLNDSTIANPTASLITSTTFVVTGISQGCTGKDTITVIVNPLPVITASNDSAICFGNSIQLYANGASFFQWQPDSSLDNAQSENPIATPQTTTTYNVIGTDANGCTNSNAVTITVNSLPMITINADTSICSGDTILMIASGALNYQWQPSSELISPLNDSTLAHPSSTTTFTVSGTDANGCKNSATKKITVHPLPNVNAGNDQQVCANSTAQLSASGAIAYSWQPTTGLDDPNISDPTATVIATITYTVTGTDVNSCSNKDEVTLNLVPPLNASASHDTTICAGTSAQLFATGGVNYNWFPVDGLNDATISNPLASPSSTTHYTVFVSDGICYTDTFTVKVSVQNLPTVNAGADASVVTGSPYQMNASASEGSYEWSPSTGLSCSTCLNPTANPSQTTTYTLTVTDSIGCSASDDVTLTSACSEDAIFIPNAFTPNGNGQNDVLYVRALGNVNLNFFRVYDRWGKIIFETHNLSEGWDGTYNNKPMMPGAYLYEWEATCGSGDLISKQGNVTLLR